MRGDRICLLLSLDVEEEGLFRGRYARRGCTTANTAALERLAPLCARGARPTLFCAHSVLTDAASCRMLDRMRTRHGAEIGAHLHHWNTPPLCLRGNPDALPDMAASVPAADLSAELLAAKLHSLVAAARDGLGARPASFRMGRWDAHRQIWPLLAQAGFLTDASVRPLHTSRTPAGGPDHFSAPAHPYRIPAGVGQAIFEVPLTVTPLFACLPSLLRRLPGRAGVAMRAGLRHWGVLALLPAYHPLWAMQAVTRAFLGRGGRVLSLTWHSSEMQPGATPHLPDARSIDKFLAKIAAWLDWLNAGWDVSFMTMDQLRQEHGATAPLMAGPGDWTAGSAA